MNGQLFTQDFLHDGIQATPVWLALTNGNLAASSASLQHIFAPYSLGSTVNEAIT